MPCSSLALSTLLAFGPAAGEGTPPEATSDTAEAPAPSEPAPAEPAPVEAAQPGTLVVGPGLQGRMEVFGADPKPLASVDLRADGEVALSLPPGTYRLVHESGAEQSVELRSGEGLQVQGDAPPPAAIEDPQVEGPGEAPQPPPAKKRNDGRWKTVVSPILSAHVPGVGQMINLQGRKGAGVLSGIIGLTTASIGLVLIRDETSGGGAGEVARLSALAATTGGAQMLYAWQIMDAHQTARGRDPRPKVKHKVSLHLMRMASVAPTASSREYGYFTDWSLGLMVQPKPKIAVGISDISIKPGGDVYDRLTVQGGLRVDFRFIHLKRWWIGGAAGAFVQGTTAQTRNSAGLSDEGESAEDTDAIFGLVPYLELEGRWFFTDRWSLDLRPRASVPLLAPRYYSFGRTLPEYAMTLEMGTGVGVHF